MTTPIEITNGDDFDAIFDGSQPPAPPSPPRLAQPPREQKLGYILDETNEKKVFEYILQEFKRDDSRHKCLEPYWDRNKYWRMGVRGQRVMNEGDPDSTWLWLPPDTALSAPSPNRVDDLIRRAIATMTHDEPVPEALPATDTSEDRDAAEFSQRWLKEETGPNGVHLYEKMEQALDRAGTYGSGYTLVLLDEYAGGHREKQIEAHPQAMTEQDAIFGPPGAPPMPRVMKYVLPDGTLSDEPAGAARQWIPKLITYTLPARAVRLLPVTSQGIEDAEGFICVLVDTLGRFKGLWPKLRQMNPEQLKKVVSWKMEGIEKFLPDAVQWNPPQLDTPGYGQEVSDDSLVCVLVEFRRACYAYPWGCYAVVGGEGMVFSKSVWMGRTLTGKKTKDGQPLERDKPLRIPVAQLRWLQDGESGNYHGVAPAEKVGPMDELIHTDYAAYAEALFKLNNPNLLVPHGTNITADQWNRRDGTPHAFVASGGQPVWEQPPNVPETLGEHIQMLKGDQDTAIGLEQAAQGVSSTEVRSGEHAKTIIEQAVIALTPPHKSAASWYVRLCGIFQELAQCFYTVPQMLRVTEDDGSYKYREWTRADLGSTRDFQIMRGSFTMQPWSAKSAMIDNEVLAGTLAPHEAQRLKRSGVSRTLGLQDQPDHQRVMRQILVWKEGPTQEEKDALQQAAQMPPEMAVQPDPTTGQPVEMPVPNPIVQQVTQRAAACFSEEPIDIEPEAAVIRWRALREVLASPVSTKYPNEWVDGLRAAYDRSRRAAGVTTLEEQQMAAQQQAEMQRQQQMEDKETDGAQRLAEKEAGQRPQLAA